MKTADLVNWNFNSMRKKRVPSSVTVLLLTNDIKFCIFVIVDKTCFVSCGGCYEKCSCSIYSFVF